MFPVIEEFHNLCFLNLSCVLVVLVILPIQCICLTFETEKSLQLNKDCLIGYEPADLTVHSLPQND